MEWSDERVSRLLSVLHARGEDWASVEVKAARGGYPEGLAHTLCAFANMPDGGTIVLGLDESAGFAPVGVWDLVSAEKRLADQARSAVVPPLAVTFTTASVQHVPILICDVAPVSSHDAPAHLRRGRVAYLRQSDGDYQMSDAEVSQVLARRSRPRADMATVDETDADDLDTDLVDAFCRAVRRRSRHHRELPDTEILRSFRVIEPKGRRLTIAGLYALGTDPQRYEPSLSATAAVRRADGPAGRSLGSLEHFSGPIPDLLADLGDWVDEVTRSHIDFLEDGRVRDRSELPATAVREILANALIHRDVGVHAQGKRVEVRLVPDMLVVKNPGGLWGVTTQQLGEGFGKSAVNEALYAICAHLHMRDGSRVIEAEGGGIAFARRAIDAAGLRPPRFLDTRVALTVELPRHALLPEEDMDWLAQLAPDRAGLDDVQRRIAVSMHHGGTWTNARVRQEFKDLGAAEARKALRGLTESGIAQQVGRGRGTAYVAADNGPGEHPDKIRPRVEGTRELPFAAVREDHRAPVREDGNPRRLPHGTTRVRVLDAIATGQGTTAGLARELDLTPGAIRLHLGALVADGEIIRHGGQGSRDTWYEVTGNQRP